MTEMTFVGLSLSQTSLMLFQCFVSVRPQPQHLQQPQQTLQSTAAHQQWSVEGVFEISQEYFLSI